MPQLELRNVHSAYGRSQVLFGVSFAVEPGECVALIGRNGVGRSDHDPQHRRARGPAPGGDRVARPERRGPAAAPDRAARDRLRAGGTADISRVDGVGEPRRWRAARRRTGGTRSGCSSCSPTSSRSGPGLGGVLTGGQQQMLTIARSLMGNPRLLLLDEPSEGLAPRVVDSLRDQVRRLKEAGLSIVLAEQNLSFVLSLSDRCHIMEKGEIKHSGADGRNCANTPRSWSDTSPSEPCRPGVVRPPASRTHRLSLRICRSWPLPKVERPRSPETGRDSGPHDVSAAAFPTRRLPDRGAPRQGRRRGRPRIGLPEPCPRGKCRLPVR